MLVDLFDQIETFFERLGIYIDVRLTEAMKNLIVKIMTEILAVLAIATKNIRQGLGSESTPTLICHLTDHPQKNI
jgi:hypothetical protein